MSNGEEPVREGIECVLRESEYHADGPIDDYPSRMSEYAKNEAVVHYR